MSVAETRRRWRRGLGHGISYGGVFVYALVVLLPLAWIVLASFKTRPQVAQQPPLLLFHPTLDNYKELFRDSEFPRIFLNSVVIAGSSTVISVTLGFMAAYAFVRFRRRKNDRLLFWILTMRMVPPLASIVPLFIVMTNLGLYDTHAGLALVYTSFNLPIATWLMLGYLEKIPPSIEEAAAVDGYSRLATLRRIVLPLAAPGLFATALICLLLSWNEFPFALNLTGESAQTLPVFVTAWDTQRGINWGPMSATVVLIIAPVVAGASVFQKWLVRGLTFGATK